VGQVVNLRRIGNPPGGSEPVPALGAGDSNCGRRIANPPQFDKLPHRGDTGRYKG